MVNKIDNKLNFCIELYELGNIVADHLPKVKKNPQQRENGMAVNGKK